MDAVINGFDMLMLSVLTLLVGCLLTLLIVLTSRWQYRRKPHRAPGGAHAARPPVSDTPF